MLWSRDRRYSDDPKPVDQKKQQASAGSIVQLRWKLCRLEEYCDNLEERIQLLEDSLEAAGIPLKQPQ